MSNHAITDAENTFVKAEPVIAMHAGAAILGYAGTLLVTHGVITHDQASALTQQVLPAVVAGLLALLGVVVRRFVAPAAAFAQRVEEEVQNRLDSLAGGHGAVTAVTAGSTALPSGLDTVTAAAGDAPIEVSASDFLPAADSAGGGAHADPAPPA